ncbi:hypothetical protein ABE354_08835 [Brevibacillus laterosporus]|uniref:hypothetical protein n=1 Tax=Brevibacillus laterosporus TaxID=1465 RepID=UPI003D1DD902
MKVTMSKIELPTASGWGMVQINNLKNTYYRFDLQHGKPVLDTSFFADTIEESELKHKYLSKDSELYQAIQQQIEEHYNELGKDQV